MLGLGIGLDALARTAGPPPPPPPEIEVLAITGAPFPVTLCRDATRYFVQETGASFLASYTGATWHVSPAGHDTTGTGAAGAPFLTIARAVIAATHLDRIQLAEAGLYAAPGAIGKSVAILGPASGRAYIGSFNSLSSATLTATADGTGVNVNLGGTDPVVGFIRTDGLRPKGFPAAAHISTQTAAPTYHNNGYAYVFSGTTASNLGLGAGNGSLPSLIAAGSILAWRASATTGISVTGTASLYIGGTITVANFQAGQAIVKADTATLILDGIDVFGGQQQVLRNLGAPLILFGVTAGGAEASGFNGDTVSYNDSAIGVEVNCTLGLPGNLEANNASTGHENTRVLRVGGTYSGGARTVHDVTNTRAYVLSCTIQDALYLDRTLLQSGHPTLADTSRLVHGNITYAGVRTNDLRNTMGAAAIRANTGEAWPG